MTYPLQTPELTGLGDLIARGTHACGLDRAAEALAHAAGWPHCGCDDRRARLNSLYPFGDRRWPRLSIVIPTCRDFYGFWATFHTLVDQILAAKLDRVCEIVVLDQSPDHEDSQHVRNAISAVASNWTVSRTLSRRPHNVGGPIDCRHVPYNAILGTAAAKQAGIMHASGEWFVCLDSHVILQADSLRRLYDFAASRRHRYSRALYYGVHLQDNHVGYWSHQEMWSDGDPSKRGQADGPMPRIGSDTVFGQWETDPRAADPKATPFDIPSSGGFLFAGRRDAFLQTSFHPLMRGFGGEEGFLPERHRRNGYAVQSLPLLRGVHRYARRQNDSPSGPMAEKLRNHLIGWLDLGYSLDLLRRVWHGRMPTDEIEATIAAASAQFDRWQTARANNQHWSPEMEPATPPACGDCPPIATSTSQPPARSRLAEVAAAERAALAPQPSPLSPADDPLAPIDAAA